MGKIIGLDLSTTTIGIGILEKKKKSIKLVKAFYFKPDKSQDVFFMLSGIKKFISELITEFKPEQVAVEDFLWGKRKTNIKTLINLAVLNRMVCLQLREEFEIIPISLAPITVRNTLKLTEEMPAKEDMPEVIAKHLKIDFPFVYNTRGRVAVESFDIADGIAVALAALKLEEKSK